MASSSGLIQRLQSSLWFRPARYAGLAVLAVTGCWLAQETAPPLALPGVDADLVATLLSIITTSMLTVTTFAVGSMVTAYASASSSGTPRAFTLIISDGQSQRAASSFIGAFIFGVIATIGLQSKLFDQDTGISMLMLMTVGIFVWVIGTFIGWIDNIARLGQVNTSISKAEDAASAALQAAVEHPHLGGLELTTRAHNTLHVHPQRFGYLGAVDMAGLQSLADEVDCDVQVWARPGQLVDPTRPVVAFASNLDDDVDVDDVRTRAADLVTVSQDRSFAADPEFTLTVLGEIAAKALSPGVNDPGTALTVINAVTRQIGAWQEGLAATDTAETADENSTTGGQQEPLHPRVQVPALDTQELVEAGYDLIVRYGIGDVDVVVHLLTAFRYLARTASDDAQHRLIAYAREVLDEARDTLPPRDHHELDQQLPQSWLAAADCETAHL